MELIKSVVQVLVSFSVYVGLAIFILAIVAFGLFALWAKAESDTATAEEKFSDTRNNSKTMTRFLLYLTSFVGICVIGSVALRIAGYLTERINSFFGFKEAIYFVLSAILAIALNAEKILKWFRS